jgi:MFS family permease
MALAPITFARQVPPHAWLGVGVLWVAATLNYLPRTMLTTMGPSIMADIPMSASQFGLLTSAFLWVYAIASLFAGFFADRFGRKRVIVFSAATWSAVTWLTAYARTFEELLVLRALLGFFESFYIPAAMALIADCHRGATRSFATGLHKSGLVLGSVLGAVGGWLAEMHGWRYAYTIIGLPSLLYALLLVFVLREPEREGPDAARSPVVDNKVSFLPALWSIARSAPFYVVIGCFCLQGAVGWMIIGWMPTYMYEHFKMGQGAAGFSALGYVYFTQFVGLLYGGYLSDRLGQKAPRARVLLPALAFMVAAPVFGFTGWSPTLGPTIASMILYGLSVGFLGANMMPIICMVSDVQYRATAVGVLNCFTACFGGAAVFLVGGLRDAQVGIGVVLGLAGIGVLGCGLLLLALVAQLRRRDRASA